MRHLSLVALTCTLACGDSGRADSESASASAGTQPTGVSGTLSASISDSGQPTDSGGSGGSGGSESGVPTTSSASSISATSDEPATGTETTNDPSIFTTTNDPSTFTTSGQPQTTGFQTGDPADCVKSLQAVIRDFNTSHPDFESYTSDGGEKGILLPKLGPDQKPVYANAGPTQLTSGPGPFSQWYHNVANVNIPFLIEMPLTEVMPGVFSYENNAFFPIDNQGWGNEGNSNNFHFTTEIHTSFSYTGGEVFTFIGDDDLWLYINNTLAIDLGGVHPQLSASVDLDQQAAALGLQVGGMYPLDVFHAERHTDQSHFRIDTSIQCFVIPG
jgi:fibro-slime domain-containing protein